MTGHLDADVLADYREGLLSERRSAQIRAHLAGCARCSSLHTGLGEVTELLASVPVPPMPEHLVTRLENALAAEAAALAKTPVTAEHVRWRGAVAGWLGVVASAMGRLRRRPTVLGAVAASVAILVVGGVYGLARVTNSTGSPPGTAAGAGAAERGNAFASHGPSEPHASLELPAGSLHVTDSGTNYQPGMLAHQVESVLSRQQSGATDFPAQAAPAQASSAQLRACVTLVTGGVPPRLVDMARYQGRPAIIIAAAAAGGRPAQVWVVGPGCSASQRDLIAHTQA